MKDNEMSELAKSLRDLARKNKVRFFIKFLVALLVIVVVGVVVLYYRLNPESKIIPKGREVIREYTRPCKCPDDLDVVGKKCGDRSALSRGAVVDCP